MAALARAAKINLNSTTALICEQYMAEQDVLVAMLNGFGLNRVTRHETMAEVMSERTKAYDLIFVGVTPVAQDAIDAIRDLRRDLNHPSRTSPVVVMSSYTPLSVVERARAAGATFVIAKPLSSQVVFDRILWLASVSRDFVEADNYFGPDRRTRNYGPPPDTAGRRDGDLSAHLGAADGSNMSQDQIDDLMKPARVTL